MITFRINVDKNLNNEKRFGILKGVMREIAEAVIQSLLEHHLLSRPLKTPPCSRETLWISHSVVHSLRVPCP